MVRFHNPFPERIGQVVRQLREFIKESRIKNLFYLAGVVLSSLKRGMPITFNLAI